MSNFGMAAIKIPFHELVEEAIKLDLDGMTILREALDEQISKEKAKELFADLEETRREIATGKKKYYSSHEEAMAALRADP